MDDELMSSGETSSFWRRNIAAVAAGAVVLTVIVSAGVYFAWHDQPITPEEVLSGMASSAVQGDFVSIANSIDTTSLVDSAVDDVLSSTHQGRLAVVSEYLSSHPENTPELLKMKARSTLDEEIREHVRSGTLPKRIPLGNGTLKALIAEAMVRKSIRSVRVDGEFAHVVVTVPYRGRKLTVKVRMRQSGDSWKIDRIENMSDVLKQAGY